MNVPNPLLWHWTDGDMQTSDNGENCMDGDVIFTTIGLRWYTCRHGRNIIGYHIHIIG